MYNKNRVKFQTSGYTPATGTPVKDPTSGKWIMGTNADGSLVLHEPESYDERTNGSTLPNGWNVPGPFKQTADFFKNANGVNFATPTQAGGIPMIEGLSTPAHIGNIYPGQFVNNANGTTTHPGVKSFQEDMLTLQSRMKSNPRLVVAMKQKYPSEKIDALMSYNLVGGADGKYGPYTSKANEDFSDVLYDYQIARSAEEQRLDSPITRSQEILSYVDPNALTATMGAGSYGVDPNAQANTGVNTTTGNVGGVNTNVDPNAQAVITNPPANAIQQGMRYLTPNGQWMTGRNPGSNLQYRSYDPNNVYGAGANNPSGTPNGVPQQFNFNAPNMQQGYGRGYNGGNGRGVGQWMQNAGQKIAGLFKPRYSQDVRDRRAELFNPINDRVAAANQSIRDSRYDRRTDNREVPRENRAKRRESIMETEKLRTLENARERDANMRNAGYLIGQNGVRRDNDIMSKESSQRYALDKQHAANNVIQTAKTTLNEVQNRQRMANQQLAIQNQQARRVQNQAAPMRSRTNRILGNMNSTLKPFPLYEEGGVVYERPKYQFAGITGSNPSDILGNTPASFQVKKPWTDGYKLPSYKWSPPSDAGKSMQGAFDSHAYGKGTEFSPNVGYHQSVANHLNGDPIGTRGSLSANLMPSQRDYSDPNGIYSGTGDADAKAQIAAGLRNSGKLTEGDKMGLWGEYLPALYNIGYSMVQPYHTKPRYNKYRYQVYNNMAKQQAPTDMSDVYALENKGMRDIRNSAPNEQVERANRLALYTGTMGELNKQKMANFMANREMATQATQQLGQIGEHERQADEAARLERIQHEEARDNIRAKGVGQFGAATTEYGKALNNSLDNQMKWNLLSQIYDKYGLSDYNEALTNGFSADELILYKNTGDYDMIMRSRKQRQAEQNKQDQSGQTQQNTQSTQNISNAQTNGAMSGSVTTNTTGTRNIWNRTRGQ